MSLIILPKCDLGRRSSGRLTRYRTFPILSHRHIDKLIDSRPHQHIQQCFRLIMTSRVFRQTSVRSIIVLVHSRNAQLAGLWIHQESIGHRHILLRRVLDPRELGHRFAGSDVAHHGELLLLDGFQTFGQVTDARFDLNLDPDVALDKLTGLDDSRATSVNSVVGFVDVANKKTACFDDISAARLNLLVGVVWWVGKGWSAFGSVVGFIAKCKVWGILLLTGSPLRSQSTVGAGLAVTSHFTVYVEPAMGN